MENFSTYSSNRDGKIVTFYSYKGGVGRSMALANVAVLLSQLGKKVLAIDWDLEAPGLNRYFKSKELYPPASSGGLLQLLETSSSKEEFPSYSHFVHSIRYPNSEVIHLLTSGDDDNDYAAKLGKFSWNNFFRQNRGAHWLERLRAQWKEDYDFVLIDSRTGITDSGGVCTIQLPDILVLIVGANQQNLEGCKKVISPIHKQRADLPFDRSKLMILPILSRFDSREESSLAKEWTQNYIAEFSPIFNDWLPKECTPLDVLERTKLPHIPRYSFGEQLAVLSERESDPDQLPYYYSTIARIILSDFHDILEILGKNEHHFEQSSNAAYDPKDAYVAALDFAIMKDNLGWRKLTQRADSHLQNRILEWQQEKRNNPPSSAEELPAMALEGLSYCAPRIAVALAGIESQHPIFSNQIGLIDDFLNLPNWERSGNTTLTRFPEAIVFVYQALAGGLAMQTSQPEHAYRLATTEVSDLYSNKVETLLSRPRLTGWPDTLNHTCTTSWDFLMCLPEHWTWLLDVYGDANSYRAAIGSYYMFLSTAEFLDAVNQNIDLSRNDSIRITVPLNFAALNLENQRKAIAIFKESIPFLSKKWRETRISNETMNKKWLQWIQICDTWIDNVYPGGFLWRNENISISALPEWIQKN